MRAIIVGGGLIGLSAAWRLRQSGLDVALWEAGRVGTEASWSGAGMLAPGGEMDQRTWWGDLAQDSLRLYPEFVRELQAESGISIDYRRCGAFEFARDDSEWEALQQRAARQREWGIVSQLAGSRKLFYPEDAAVDPRHLLRALHIACERVGVTIYQGREVQRIVVERGRIVEPEPADVAIVAAGAWSSTIPILAEGSAVSVEPAVPVRGHLVSFLPDGQVPGPIWRDAHTYILERSDGVTIAGSTTEEVGFDRKPNPTLFTQIILRAQQLMPRLERARVLDQWIGFRPGTRSGEPQLGFVNDLPVFLAYGHYRNGILMAPATANFIVSSLRMGSFGQVVRP